MRRTIRLMPSHHAFTKICNSDAIGVFTAVWTENLGVLDEDTVHVEEVHLEQNGCLSTKGEKLAGSWSLEHNTLSLKIHSTRCNIAWAKLCSADGGCTWFAVSTECKGALKLFLARHSGSMFEGSGRAQPLFRCADWGITWEAVD